MLTTKELIHMFKEMGIQLNEIEPSAPDMPFSISSGAGVIFGVTGGVTEAALRKVVSSKTNAKLKEIEYSGVRGMEGIKSAQIAVDNQIVRLAGVSGLGNAEKLIEVIESSKKHFDFVEDIACPYGCIAGAGQLFSHKADKES